MNSNKKENKFNLNLKLSIILNKPGKFSFILCFIFATLFPVENLYSNLSGNESGSVSKASSYGIISVTNWANDRNSAFSFSFDDGFISQYENVRVIFNQFDFRGTFYILPPFLRAVCRSPPVVPHSLLQPG